MSKILKRLKTLSNSPINLKKRWRIQSSKKVILKRLRKSIKSRRSRNLR